MKEVFDGRILYGTSVVIALVGVSIWAIARAGRRLKGELAVPLSANKGAGFLPPKQLKKALELGLVTPSQLAKMTPLERQFLFATFKDSLDEGNRPGG